MSKLGDVTLNGQDCFGGELILPYQGAWVADLTVDADSPPSGSASLNFAGRMLSGSVVHDPADPASVLSGDSGGIKRVRIVGGAGGLYQQLSPKSYDNGSTVGTILSDLLGAGGETAAADIDPGITARLLPQWSWTGGTLMGALQQLAQVAGGVFRVRDGGQIWVGVPTPAAVTPPDYVLLDVAPEAGQASFGLDDSSLEPDQVVDGLALRQVTYLWEPGEMRALVTYAPGPVSALFGLFGVWLRRAGIEFLRPQPGRINSFSNDGTAEVQPDDVSNYPPLRRAAQRYGLPDTSCTGVTGRCAVGWEAGSPSFPAILNYGSSTATKIKIGASAVGPPAGTQPLVTQAMRTAQQTLDSSLFGDFVAAGIALNSAGADPALVAVAPTAAAALQTAATALGAATGAAKAIQTFESAASANSNFLTTIVEAG